MVKIQTANHAGEPVLRGGIYLQRGKFVGKVQASIPFLHTLAEQISAALIRAEGHAETIEREKLTRELEVAGQIQATFLPHKVPALPGWDLTATLQPARQTSGDFYDFVALPDNRLGIVIADVADKGTGAALYMALSRTLIRTYALAYPNEPARALQTANERILADTESDQFVTLFYAVFDIGSGSMTYVNAGHNPPLLISTNSPPRRLIRTGIPLGIMEGMEWQEEQIVLQPNDLLVMYTDGVSEAQNKVNDEYGETCLLEIVTQTHLEPTSSIETAILSSINLFVGDAPQFDDITLLLLHRHEQPSENTQNMPNNRFIESD
jgi:serine phosphatase RsbU (regulator of sigma subunit)